MTYAVPTSANWSLQHGAVNNEADLGATSFPTSTAYAQWLVWATKEVNAYMRVTSDVSDSEALQTVEVVIDKLLIRKWEAERKRRNQVLPPASIVDPSLSNDQDPEMVALAQMLDRIMPGTDTDDAPAVTRAMHRGTWNNSYTLD